METSNPIEGITLKLTQAIDLILKHLKKANINDIEK